MKINTYTIDISLEIEVVFIRIWHFVNVYKPSHKKSHFFKIGIFCKKIITLSGSAHLIKKSTFLTTFQFFCTTLTFLHQNWHWQKHLSYCLKVYTTFIYHCTYKFTHLPKNWRILHKMLFFTKRKQRHQKFTLFKNRRYFFKKT